MSGHRAFKELTKGHSPARKARVASKVAALESALALHAPRKVKVSQQALAQKRARPSPA